MTMAQTTIIITCSFIFLLVFPLLLLASAPTSSPPTYQPSPPPPPLQPSPPSQPPLQLPPSPTPLQAPLQAPTPPSPPANPSPPPPPPVPVHSSSPPSASPPPPPPSSTQPPQEEQPRPQQPQRQEERQQQMDKILEALIGSGDFANWANILNFADPSSILPFTSTLFVPNNDVLTHLDSIDPYLFLYHIVPHRLSFTDLHQLFPPQTRLPTLLPGYSILIFNTSIHNFTIDGAKITDPDLYSSDSVSVHGIDALLDYRIFGGNGTSSSSSSPIQLQSPPPAVTLHKSDKGPILFPSTGWYAVLVACGLLFSLCFPLF